MMTREQVEKLKPLASCVTQTVDLGPGCGHLGIFSAMLMMIDTDAAMRQQLEEVERKNELLIQTIQQQHTELAVVLEERDQYRHQGMRDVKKISELCQQLADLQRQLAEYTERREEAILSREETIAALEIQLAEAQAKSSS